MLAATVGALGAELKVEEGAMHRIRIWLSVCMARVSQLAILAPLYEVADKSVVLGGLAGGMLMFLVGALLGAGNRGFAGAVVGAFSAMIAGALLGGLVGSLFASRQGEVRARFELEGQSNEYDPGDAVSGYVVLHAIRSGRIQGGKVLLVCQGLYVHDEDTTGEDGEPTMTRQAHTYHVQELPTVPAGTVRRGVLVRYPFRIALPAEMLPTHHGFACSVRWGLHLDLEDGLEQSDQAKQELFIRAVNPIGVGSRPERVSATASSAELTLSLPRTAFTEGETLQGRLIVNPGEDLLVSEVRALLLRVEHNPNGHDHVVYINGWNAETGRFRGESRPGGEGTTYVWLEDEADLAEQVRLTQGEKRLFDFGFQIPQQWRPTLRTEHGDVSWRVVAILSRPHGRDLRAQMDIIVHTGSPHIARIVASERGEGGGAEDE